jgi:alkylation response protein AidB-like acyl-CoA dehydrogenase
MRFAFTADQLEMQAAVGAAMRAMCTPAVLRDAWADRTASPWSALAELGVLGVEAPDGLGGLELGPLEWVLLLEESGRVGFPGPLVETIASIPALVEANEHDLVSRVVRGEATVSLSLDGGFALDADTAELVLVLDDGRLFAVRNPSLVRQNALDATRRLFAVSGERELLDADGAAVLDRAVVAASAQLLGLSRHILDAAVGYAKERRQFGKPIGSFQAVQHHLVDALLALTFAAPLVHRAAWSLAEGDPTRAAHASMAMLRAAAATTTACRKSLQVHGAIGYTSEYDLQLWMKRAWALSRAWGSPGWHRDRVAAHFLGDESDA